MSRLAALIVAAGAGTRFGGTLPKVFVELAGQPLVAWPLQVFAQCAAVAELCLVVSPEYVSLAEELCAAHVQRPVRVAAGGAERRVSVLNGLRALQPEAPEFVAIHDGARPLITDDLIADSLAVARQHGAAIAAVQAIDTVKQVESGRITGTVDRRQVYLAQTPQTFRFDLILHAHEQAEAGGWEVTDDAMLLERLGHPVHVSRGDCRNLKVTTAEDLHRAEMMLMPPQPPRIGHGFDLHRLVEGRRLVLGGIEIPHSKGLLGHSDADAALHAISDALLGAVALGDIGQHFPDTDPQYRGADSVALLRHVVALVREAGWQVGNADVTILAQEPRLSPHIEAMRRRTAKALAVTPEQVSYKATTMEKLGPIGAGEAIAAEAIVLLVRKAV